METDKLRLAFTYLIAILVIVGAGSLIFQKLPDISAESLLALATFILGTVLSFVFNKESSTSGARAQERAFTQGANAASPTPTITTSAGPPATVTVTPAPESDAS